MLSYAKSGTARTGDRLNGLDKGKTQQFNSGGVVKWAYFQKKVEYPFKYTTAKTTSLTIKVPSLKASEQSVDSVRL